MTRSTKKGPYVNPRYLKHVLDANKGTQSKPITVWDRASMIHPDFVGKWFEVHNGKEFSKVFVREDMVGHRFGEFSVTRKFRGHGQVVKRIMAKT